MSELPRLVDSIKNGVQGFALFHRTGIISELVKVRDSPSKMTTALENVFRCAAARLRVLCVRACD